MVISPKSKTVSHIFPYIYGSSTISEDQVYDGCSFFDCTNYYFEIGITSYDKQKGPSKENRHSQIIGQALLLDADLVPVSIQIYPGNELEKPYIRIDLNKSKIDEVLKYAGYYLLVASDIDMKPLQLYKTSHSLWKREESFRLKKSYLDARPVYL